MVKSVMPALGSLFLVAVVADKESAGNLVMLCLDNNLALLTYADTLAVGVNYIDIKCRNIEPSLCSEPKRLPTTSVVSL